MKARPKPKVGDDAFMTDDELMCFHKQWPNAQVQGRALGVAEACTGGGVPCNAQLGRCK